MTAVEIVFWAAATFIAYSYLGYPALLALAARLRPAPAVQKSDLTPSVSVLIVAHDEEARIASKLRNCLELDYPRERIEVLVASDGSQDRTEEIVRGFASEGVRLLALPGPHGKPAALNRTVPETRGEILVLCDARQSLARDAVRQLAANFADPSVGAVSGELHIEAAPGSASGEGVGLYWSYEKLIRRTESRLDSTVGVTGAIYAIRKHLFRPLDPRTILDDVAVPMAVVEAGYRVVFDPLARAYDQASDSPAQEYRRKARTLAGNFQLLLIRPSLLVPRRNRLLWQFVSHKLSRLAVPWCLLLLLAASAWLSLGDAPLYRLAALGQAVFYLMALAGWSLEKRGVSGKPLSLPYAFALLNLAAASSLFGFLLGRHKAAWRSSIR